MDIRPRHVSTGLSGLITASKSIDRLASCDSVHNSSNSGAQIGSLHHRTTSLVVLEMHNSKNPSLGGIRHFEPVGRDSSRRISMVCHLCSRSRFTNSCTFLRSPSAITTPGWPAFETPLSASSCAQYGMSSRFISFSKWWNVTTIKQQLSSPSGGGPTTWPRPPYPVAGSFSALPNTKSRFWSKKKLNFEAKIKIWGFSTSTISNF